MKNFPEYCENIIVGVIYKNDFNWYVTDKELWYLDYKKYYYLTCQAYIDRGYDMKKINDAFRDFENFCGGRWGIAVVDSAEDVDKFMLKIAEYKVSSDELRDYINIAGEDERCSFIPAVLADFDRKILYNYIPEPIFFDQYVPDGWQGKYDSFYDIIPEDKKYF